MSEKEIDIWRQHEYGNNFNPKEDSLRTIENALYSIRLNRTHEESVEELIVELEDKYYKPKEKDGKYYCPNCGEEIKYGQTICSDETCGMELVWR